MCGKSLEVSVEHWGTIVAEDVDSDKLFTIKNTTVIRMIMVSLNNTPKTKFAETRNQEACERSLYFSRPLAFPRGLTPCPAPSWMPGKVEVKSSFIKQQG